MAFGDMKVLGYSDKISVAPGETIDFMVSCDGVSRFRADIVRIISGDPNPAGAGYKEKVIKSPVSGNHRGRKQAVLAGSYAVVPPVPALDRLESLSVQAMIWPTTPLKGEQSVIARWQPRQKTGFRLMIDGEGALALSLGDDGGRGATVSTGRPLRDHAWYFVGASFDAESRTVTLHQEPLEHHPRDDSAAEVSRTVAARNVGAPNTPLTMAAHISGAQRGRAVPAGLYNGKIDSPRLADRALSRAEMSQLMQPVVPGHLATALVGAWDFAKDITGTRITDMSDNGLHGETVNLPARAMTGHNWTGEESCWRAAPDQYGAIHFHDDDLYDAGWEPTISFTVPKGLQSGCYAARLSAGGDEDYVPFYVRPAGGKAKRAKILYLAPTASYMAYANILFELGNPGAELFSGRLVVVQPWHEQLNLHSELGLSLYDLHTDGSGICYSSRLRPILNMRPKVITPAPGGDASGVWGYNADTHLTGWLDAMGHRFDVITDEDLDRDGVASLLDYNVVLTGSHPEYYSTPMWDALKAYTERGGRLMYMGGNGFYWRIAYHKDLPGVIEVRRGGESTRAWRPEPGEEHHSFTGELGGTWRRIGRPPQKLAASGFVAQGFDFSTYYRRTPESKDPRVAWMFDGIGDDELIGDFGLCGGGAAGLEVDIADHSLGTPPHALVVAQSEGLSDLYLLVAEELLLTMPDLAGTTNPRIRADIVYCEKPNGGAIWSSSSIAWCGALPHNKYDNNVSRLSDNVLRRFAADGPIG